MAAVRRSLGLGSQVQHTVSPISQSKGVEFFREVARCLPSIVKQYKLDELTSVSELRKSLAQMFRVNEGVKDPAVINLLIYKGREELEMILMQHKQRHHLIDRYIKNPSLDRIQKPQTMSPFLEQFYNGN